ncbi:ribonucleotide reductase of class Ia [Agrobacterium phage OLIVR5]|uniref:ribonucleoside-diphosphate reductase n=1 Tax=Agrobacterium phage OLIVR5 TaxID=2723773 RepID=A0A858MSS8_9CAUD|nr:ribonucleotide reductase of class Ia [Agrobacterium phage OLIVR5]QIW87827.1 ribonucleotide reductase of class Ia [Agrobacterium phage OLIVR5]QIW88092.1 ribonucleotide reductase of class Ia [Agrobacterium phage OLIVR6]
MSETNIVKIFEPCDVRRPNYYPFAEELSDKILKGFWSHLRFTFKRDVNDFHTLFTDEERDIIVRDLSMIGQVEINVKRYWANIGNIFPHPFIEEAGFIFSQNEVVHNRAYEKLLRVLNMEDIFQENLKLPFVADRVKYLKKHTEKTYENDRQQQLYSLVLFTLFVENVSLFSQFYIMRWFNRWHPEHQNNNPLSETAVQIQYTRNEETLHAQFGIKLFNTAREQYPELVTDDFIEKIRKEAMSAYIAECNVLDWILDGYDKPKLSSKILKSFIQKRIDDSLIQINIDPLFTEHKFRALDSEHKWFFDEEVSELDADNFDAHNDAYTRDDREYDIDTDIISF